MVSFSDKHCNQKERNTACRRNIETSLVVVHVTSSFIYITCKLENCKASTRLCGDQSERVIQCPQKDIEQNMECYEIVMIVQRHANIELTEVGFISRFCNEFK